MKFHILIFGCQMNYSDGARIRAILLNCWFSYTDDITKADIVIFDTCSVKQKAEDKITGKLKEIWKHQTKKPLRLNHLPWLDELLDHSSN
jgi:tRNA-2-methylthio-N6-dimethylallyladenosine synthase